MNIDRLSNFVESWAGAHYDSYPGDEPILAFITRTLGAKADDLSNDDLDLILDRVRKSFVKH